MSTYYNIPIQSHKTSVKGWTSGRTEFSAKHFRFVLDDGVAFEVPLASLTAAQQQRHEAILEFQIVRLFARLLSSKRRTKERKKKPQEKKKP